MKILVIVDYQNDFVNGTLGSEDARKIEVNILNKIQEYKGEQIYFTRDTHYKNYLETQEGKNLPVKHCIYDTKGWDIIQSLVDKVKFLNIKNEKINKNTFGSVKLAKKILNKVKYYDVTEIEIIGVCTDICVISNALLIKAFYPEAKITVDASCCAGITPESHKNALNAMKMCQINIINE